MDGDRPITRAADDRLGFETVAKHLAQAILEQSSRDGFVIGIDGSWGSGKSTLVNLTIEELKRAAAAPAIVMFSPWLVGDRDTLLQQLFDELASAALEIEPIGTTAPKGAWERFWAKLLSRDWRRRQKEQAKRRLARQLHYFGIAAGGIGSLTKAAGALGVPWAAQAGTLAQGSRDAVSSFLAGGALSKRKAEIVTLLGSLSRPIVVFVDDLDRLEPKEASEVLRLIRAVADFPNVVYIVSYDADVVAGFVNSALQLNSGGEYLEKIVQVSFRVPLPEPFDLRNWFRVEVDRIFDDQSWSDEEGNFSESREARLYAIIYGAGTEYLRTPRDVVRTLNAVRLHSAPVRGLVDVPDMVWLQLVKIGNPDLYSWTEGYLSKAAGLLNGEHVSDEDAGELEDRLKEILEQEGGDTSRKIYELSRILPGIDMQPTFGNQRERRVLKSNLLIDYFIGPLIANKRLGSPQHFRYYFSFTEPGGALRDEIVRQFVVDAAEAPDKALATFSALASKPRPQGGSMGDVLIDRLIAISNRIPENAVLGILKCFAATMDPIAKSAPASDFGSVQSWSLASKLTRACLDRVPDNIRQQAIHALFAEGRSIGWLTDMLRQEIFDHGVFGDRQTAPDDWLLTPEEFDDVLSMMLDRYGCTAPTELMETPNFLSLLYGWLQGGRPDEVRAWIDTQAATDTGLLALLPRMRSMALRDAVVYPLNKTDMVRFFDYESLLGRVKSIIDNENVTEEERSKAREIMQALRLGEKSHQ